MDDTQFMAIMDELETLHRKHDDFRIEVKMNLAEILGLLRPGVPGKTKSYKEMSEEEKRWVHSMLCGDDVSALQTFSGTEDDVKMNRKIKEEE